MKRIAVIGGDRRQAILAELLAEDGWLVCTAGLGVWSLREVPLHEAAQADVVILPLPLCGKDGILNCAGEEQTTDALFALLGAGKRVLAGQVKPAQWAEAKRHGICLRDYFLCEEVTVTNAAATAEAAVQVAMERMERTLLGMESLVLGFGRIGKLLSFRLHGLGSRVTATARKPEDLAWIDAYGWRAMETGEALRKLSRFPVIFNTIPYPIINKKMLCEVEAMPLVVDLASVQGLEASAVERLGEWYIWAKGLPGKRVPYTAAMAIRRGVHTILREWEGEG